MMLILCVALCGNAQAQRLLPGQKALQVTAGAVDGFRLSRQDGQAFAFGAGMVCRTGSGNHRVFGVEYIQKNHRYGDVYIPLSQFTGEAGYYLHLLSDRSKTLFLRAGVSAMAGYESINSGKRRLFDGATIAGGDSFLYGGAAGLEIETFLGDRFTLLLHLRERMLFGSAVNTFHTHVGIGLRINIR